MPTGSLWPGLRYASKTRQQLAKSLHREETLQGDSFACWKTTGKKETAVREVSPSTPSLVWRITRQGDEWNGHDNTLTREILGVGEHQRMAEVATGAPEPPRHSGAFMNTSGFTRLPHF